MDSCPVEGIYELIQPSTNYLCLVDDYSTDVSKDMTAIGFSGALSPEELFKMFNVQSIEQLLSRHSVNYTSITSPNGSTSNLLILPPPTDALKGILDNVMVIVCIIGAALFLIVIATTYCKQLRDEAEARAIREDVKAKQLRDEAIAKDLQAVSEARQLRDEAEARAIREEARAIREDAKAEAKAIREDAKAEAKAIREDVKVKQLRDEAEARAIREDVKAKQLRDEAAAKGDTDRIITFLTALKKEEKITALQYANILAKIIVITTKNSIFDSIG